MGLFNINGGFAKFVNRALDLLLLNFLWFVFSLGIITVGASTCAAYSVSIKLVDDEEGYIAKQFVKAFKDNFKQGTFMWLITLPWLVVVGLSWWVVTWAEDYYFFIMTGAILLTALFLAFNLYAYPLIARYDNKFHLMLKNSLGITLIYFARTLLIIVILAVEVLVISWNKWTIFAGLLIGPEAMIYTVSGMSKRIFQQIERHEEQNSGTINQ